MQLIQNILSFNQILTVSLLGWLVAQVLKTIINFILLGTMPWACGMRLASRPRS